MKTLLPLIFLSIILLIFSSCGDGLAPNGVEDLPKIDTFDCPQPKYRLDGIPENQPAKAHKLQRVSPDGSNIAYVQNERYIKILDLKTGAVETYDPKVMMDSNVFFNGCFAMRWCPYDNNKLCFMFVTAIDTMGSGGRKKYGQNLFILYRKEKRFDRIDLPFASRTGPEGLFLYGWLKGSTPKMDSLFLVYGVNQKSIYGIVTLQEKKIVPVPEFEKVGAIGTIEDFSYSPNRSHSVSLLTDISAPYIRSAIYIDGIPLEFPRDTLELLKKASWSPDGEKLAVTLRLSSQNSHPHETVWVIDVEKWLRERPAIVPIEKIDFQKRFCMYNLSGYGSIGAEFLNNKTLAVSCHHDGDMLCPLWEITTDGRLLRQITKDD